jgi:hypothetical protein
MDVGEFDGMGGSSGNRGHKLQSTWQTRTLRRLSSHTPPSKTTPSTFGTKGGFQRVARVQQMASVPPAAPRRPLAASLWLRSLFRWLDD